MRVRVLRAVTFSLSFLLLAGALGHAQSPPAPPGPPQAPPPTTGFMPPYEITSIVRSAGFDPLAPPLREGTTYVLRATDFRGILMRVVVDAHSGAIRAVNRIVPGPGFSGLIGMVPPPYGVPDLEGPDKPPSDAGAVPPAPRTAVRASVAVLPPLPRPRPATLASRKDAEDAMSSAPPAGSPSTPADKPDVKSNTVIAAPAAAPVAPNKPPAPAPLND